MSSIAERKSVRRPPKRRKKRGHPGLLLVLALALVGGIFLCRQLSTPRLDPETYPESLRALLERNPETRDFVLAYPEEKDRVHEVDLSEYEHSDTVPLFMQWDQRWGYLTYGDDCAGLTACGPVCLSMVAVYLLHDSTYSPDYMIQWSIDHGYCVPGSGSAWALIGEGGRQLGLDVTELPLDEGRIRANLEAGNPVICVMGPGDFTTTGHFIVLTSMEDGKITLNDPNSRKNSSRTWSFDELRPQIANLWALRT